MVDEWNLPDERRYIACLPGIFIVYFVFYLLCVHAKEVQQNTATQGIVPGKVSLRITGNLLPLKLFEGLDPICDQCFRHFRMELEAEEPPSTGIPVIKKDRLNTVDSVYCM